MKTLQTEVARTALFGLVLVWTSLQATGALLRVPAQYPTIQTAVDAATSGDEIRIAAGTYTEQVAITNKDLRLAGEPGAVLKAFPGMTSTLILSETEGPRRVLLLVLFCDDVTVRGLTVDGGRLGDVNPGLLGVIFHGSGGRLENSTVRGFRGDPGLTFGLGLGAGNFPSLNRGLLRLEVRHNTFEDNMGSISMNAGNAGGPAELRLQFQIEGNVIRGVGPTVLGPEIGMNLREGTGGEVKHNFIAGHNYAGPDLLFSFGIDAHGIGEPLLPIRYIGNVFQENQIHLASFISTGAQVVANTFEGPGTGPFNIGIASSGTEDRILANTFRNLTSGVILVGNDPIFGTTLGIASDTTLIANRFCEVGTPILVEPLVTGVQEQGNRLNGCRQAKTNDDRD